MSPRLAWRPRTYLRRIDRSAERSGRRPERLREQLGLVFLALVVQSSASWSWHRRAPAIRCSPVGRTRAGRAPGVAHPRLHLDEVSGHLDASAPAAPVRRRASATSSPRRRPANAAVRNSADVLLGRGCPCQRVDLLGRVEVEARRVVADADPVDIGDRLRGRSYNLRARSMIPCRMARSLAPCRRAEWSASHRILPRLDPTRCDLVDRQDSELGQQVALEDRAAVHERRALPAPVVLVPAQPLDRGLFEGHAGAHEVESAPTRVGQDRLERGLGGAAVIEAGRRCTSLGPVRSEQLLDLPHAARPRRIGHAVLDVPDRTAASRHAPDIAADRRKAERLESSSRRRRYSGVGMRMSPEPSPVGDCGNLGQPDGRPAKADYPSTGKAPQVTLPCRTSRVRDPSDASERLHRRPIAS
jgi:hypothetical protein